MVQLKPNILTKLIQSSFHQYFSNMTHMSKPEKRCLKDMVMGVLKSKSVFVNQIASSLKEKSKLKIIAKRLGAHYLKPSFSNKVRTQHIEKVENKIKSDGFMTLDETDIQKKFAKKMEGLEQVKDGDSHKIGLGYKIINVNYINKFKEILPLISKAYSFEMKALSVNNEIKNAIIFIISLIKNTPTWVFDRGMDNQILKNFFFDKLDQFILRLKKNTTLYFNGEKMNVTKLKNKVTFSMLKTVSKTKSSKKRLYKYKIGAIKVQYKIENQYYDAWLVISQNQKHEGLCYLLYKGVKNNEFDVINEAFDGYGYRWKIEEYHRHIKQEYKLEDIQIKSFDGIQSMLSILTVAMSMIYYQLKTIHINLLLDSGYNLLNKNTFFELTNFIYYKISKIVSLLLIPVKLRHKINNSSTDAQLEINYP